MKKYYELDPNNPYYPYMQDTRVEQAKTEQEKDELQWKVGSALIANQLETSPIPPFQWAYLMYCAMNDIPQDESLEILLSVNV